MENKSYRLTITRIILTIFLCMYTATPCLAVKDSGHVDEQATIDTTGSDGATFEYQFANRLDPFLPFVRDEQEQALNSEGFIDVDEELVGMQLFEPDQLRVVGVIISSRVKLAMVQDVIGLGYNISVGTKIGKRGVVKDISTDGVVIEETAMTIAGVLKTNRIVMALKPEGE